MGRAEFAVTQNDSYSGISLVRVVALMHYSSEKVFYFLIFFYSRLVAYVIWQFLEFVYLPTAASLPLLVFLHSWAQ